MRKKLYIVILRSIIFFPLSFIGLCVVLMVFAVLGFLVQGLSRSLLVTDLQRGVEKIELVDSIESVSTVLHEYGKDAEMTILLKNGLKIRCYGIQHGYERKLLFSFAQIVGYTAYRCSYNTNNTIRNIFNVEEYHFGHVPVYLDDLLDVVSSLEESDGGSLFFITDESFLEKTTEEMYRLLPGSPWDYSEDGVYYKFFFVRETAGHFNN